MLFSNFQLKSLWGMNKAEWRSHLHGGKKWRLKNIARINELKRRKHDTMNYLKWPDLLDYNLEIHGISSTNSVLISYMFFKCHFKNSCHKHHTFNGSLLLSKLSSGLNMFCVHDPTQTGWTALSQTHLTLPHLFALPRTFFLKISLYREVYLTPSHSSLSVKKKMISFLSSLLNFLGRSDPLSPALSSGTSVISPSLVQTHPTL